MAPSDGNAMATLTLIHQGHVQGSYAMAGGTLLIGSDPASDVVIDGAGIAPLHAVIQAGPGASVLRQGDGHFPVTLNGQPTREHLLKDGDRIGIGCYVLFYVEEAGSGDEAAPQPAARKSEAYLQWRSGTHIGRMLPLRNALTQVGKPGQGEGAALIAKRQEGYFFSAIDHDEAVKINRRAIGDTTVQLRHGDMLDIGKQQLQFFQES